MTIGEFIESISEGVSLATIAVLSLDLIELLRASPSPAHWRLADALEQAAA